jgi:hypothetical protein
LWVIPLTYPEKIIAMNRGLLPFTTLVRKALIMDTGQPIPKQSNIIASKTLIIIIPLLPDHNFLFFICLLNVIMEKRIKSNAYTPG